MGVWDFGFIPNLSLNFLKLIEKKLVSAVLALAAAKKKHICSGSGLPHPRLFRLGRYAFHIPIFSYTTASASPVLSPHLNQRAAVFLQVRPGYYHGTDIGILGNLIHNIQHEFLQDSPERPGPCSPL